ncbi:hypothetical protein P154DRAFT_525852 [Amniculicola lignicola CBS 123094]|uniref:Uncharacterized protein n=1 Tax=Amniculicola lignicola CBS 123094 TaxID=1392246 RepID=A0A6A5W2P1_9PLEO|nr:hypothetical protein P154DRAFT_525852 [Amniculicola lignicola CBS 123094]
MSPKYPDREAEPNFTVQRRCTNKTAKLSPYSRSSRVSTTPPFSPSSLCFVSDFGFPTINTNFGINFSTPKQSMHLHHDQYSPASPSSGLQGFKSVTGQYTMTLACSGKRPIDKEQTRRSTKRKPLLSKPSRYLQRLCFGRSRTLWQRVIIRRQKVAIMEDQGRFLSTNHDMSRAFRRNSAGPEKQP